MRSEISTTTEAAGAPVARVAASKHFLPAILLAVCFGVRRGKALCPSGCESRPATVAPAGSSRSGAGR